MQAGELISMASTGFHAYTRRRKVTKEELHGRKAILYNQQLDALNTRQCPLWNGSASQILSPELDAAEILADLWRTGQQTSRESGLLAWSCKRKRTSHKIVSIVPFLETKEEPEDALSIADKRGSSSNTERDMPTTESDDAESAQCSKESSSFLNSGAQSPSSPLPSIQLPSSNFLLRGSTKVKSAFHRVLSLAPGTSTVKPEIEEMHSGPLNLGSQQCFGEAMVSTAKVTYTKVPVKTELVADHRTQYSDEIRAISMPIKSSKCDNVAALSRKIESTISEDKEARRIRRIQANRESARQTIRKRQVLCEELSKKASSLALENKYMKQRRDYLVQEMLALQGQNFQLKQQLETRSSTNSGCDIIDPSNKTPDPVAASVPQAYSMPLKGCTPSGLIWSMVVASATENQAYTLDRQPDSEADGPQQGEKMPLVSSSLASFKPEATEQSSCPGKNSSLSNETPHQEDAVPGVCRHSIHNEEFNCGPPHISNPAVEFASGNFAGKPACGFSAHSGCHVTSSGKSELNMFSGITANSKSTECISVGSCVMQGPSLLLGPTCSVNYNGSMLAYGNVQANIVQGKNIYAAMAATEARRRRKELTRSKLLRSRFVRPAAVTC
ncbi:hypothetical protein KP509_30G042900 [Ceratopteris richardii]|uniref:BZIP domain-containing protein n=1 Tax=Ceratopteris richardii TaxID=49495 RepID=A0A8T2R2X7_CERRI|nr:hypothetical protein KP509_30G042900 [Ceratopteris richardii]KAH7290333.1 hypothetical protein KP509_30G042900 [Ceratopteris richardii]